LNTEFVKSSMIAPCGMNCTLCLAYHRAKNRCLGCISSGVPKANHCITCSIKNCEELLESSSKYCFSCEKYPCGRIKNIDKRYRTKYGMSMIENLDNIKKMGIREFIKLEKQKWTCPKCGNIICVHKESCLACGRNRN
jgi:hypothetical protein